MDGPHGAPPAGPPPPLPREVVKPSVTELSREVRTNILCTVQGCGKILPNSPALNMHLVKSHRIKDGMVNPTVRKDMKGSQKLYCCPIEGCPRGANRPFSQFSLVKQHFMKMHAEKKHKCFKCNNGYSTEWDLRRHVENCGKTYQCTCGCPYASRAALLSHIYRTGHEIPTEHRFPPVKKRKMEQTLSASEKPDANGPPAQNTTSAKEAPASEAAVRVPACGPSPPSKAFQKVLLPKPKMALVSVPVMQLAHLPVLLPSADRGGALGSVVLAVDPRGSVGTLHLLPQTPGATGAQLDAKGAGYKSPAPHPAPGPVSTGVQADLAPAGADEALQRGRSTSATIQTDKSYLSEAPGPSPSPAPGPGPPGESSVSSCSQTDISVSAQVLLPVSVETQTWSSSQLRPVSSIGAQTDRYGQIAYSSPPPPPYKTRQTQTCVVVPKTEESAQDRPVVCSDLFGADTLSVSTQTALEVDHALRSAAGMYEDPKGGGGGGDMCFGVRADELNPNGVADNQTQTMTLLSDLENILSDSMSGHQVLAHAASGLGAAQEQPHAIDFDFEDFLSAVHIQTQTEESELAGLSGDAPLESLDIQTQTDFLLMDEAGQSRTPASDLELFDIQTQTDLNFLLSAGAHVPLSTILRHPSFSIGAESSHTETQTDLRARPRPSSSAETQTAAGGGGSEGLGHLFLTSNETQTAVDDFLSADPAWSVVSHFSSVETQTCEELCALLQQPDKPNS